MKLQPPPKRVLAQLRSLVKESFLDRELETVYVTAALTILLRWHGFEESIPIRFHPSIKSISKNRKHPVLGLTSFRHNEILGVDLIKPSKWRAGWRAYLKTVAHECAHVCGTGHVEGCALRYESYF